MTITAGQTLTTRSLCDYDCIYTVKVLDRKKSFATVSLDRNGGEVKRVKVYEWEGREYIMPYGKYSMAPRFYADNKETW